MRRGRGDEGRETEAAAREGARGTEGVGSAVAGERRRGAGGGGGEVGVGGWGGGGGDGGNRVLLPSSLFLVALRTLWWEGVKSESSRERGDDAAPAWKGRYDSASFPTVGWWASTALFFFFFDLIWGVYFRER